MTVVLREWETFAGSNTPVVGATVNARVASSTHPSAAAVVASTTTNASGMWEFIALADATYDVDITYNGRTRWRKGLSLFSNAITPANFAAQTANKILAGPASAGPTVPTFRDLVSADFPAALWTTSNPTTVDQAGSRTFTVTAARLFTLGKFVCYICQLTITAVGSAGTAIAVTVPFTLTHNAGQAVGTFRYDRTAPATHTGMVGRGAAGNVVAFAVPTLGFVGSLPSFATANGDFLWFMVMGETT